jgi:hypothetical protein
MTFAFHSALGANLLTLLPLTYFSAKAQYRSVDKVELECRSDIANLKTSNWFKTMEEEQAKEDVALANEFLRGSTIDKRMRLS